MFPAAPRLQFSREHHDPDGHEHRNDQRGGEPAHFEASFLVRFGQRVAERRPQRTRENIGRPEEHAGRNLREPVRERDQCNQAGKEESATGKAQPRIRTDAITQGRAESVRNEDSYPVEDLVFPIGNVLILDLSRDLPPGKENGQHAAKKQDRRDHVTQTYRPVEIVRHGRAHRRGRNHHGPIDKRVVALRSDLGGERDRKETEKDEGAHGIAESESHRHSIRAGLAQRGRQDLDDPKDQCHVGDFAG